MKGLSKVTLELPAKLVLLELLGSAVDHSCYPPSQSVKRLVLWRFHPGVLGGEKEDIEGGGEGCLVWENLMSSPMREQA